MRSVSQKDSSNLLNYPGLGEAGSNADNRGPGREKPLDFNTVADDYGMVSERLGGMRIIPDRCAEEAKKTKPARADRPR